MNATLPFSRLSLLGLSLLMLAGCGKGPEQAAGPGAGGQAGAKVVAGGNHLSMRLNGTEWVGDSNFFAAFHPGGYNKAILMAGSKGPKNKDEQVFSLNLFNAEGPGTYRIKTGNADLSVVQLANLTPEKFMYGSLMGFDLTVKVIKASSGPGTVVEATFEGTLTGNAGDTLKVTEGRFVYNE